MPTTFHGTMNHVVDALTILKDAGAVTATGQTQVSAANVTLDLMNGATVGFALTGDDAVAYIEFDWVVDVSAIDVSSGNELYNLVLEGCNTQDFSTGSPEIGVVAILSLGHSSVIVGGNTSSTTGRRVMPCCNRSQDGKHWRYLRQRHIISGTTPSINYTSRLGLDMQ